MRLRSLFLLYLLEDLGPHILLLNTLVFHLVRLNLPGHLLHALMHVFLDVVDVAANLVHYFLNNRLSLIFRENLDVEGERVTNIRLRVEEDLALSIELLSVVCLVQVLLLLSHLTDVLFLRNAKLLQALGRLWERRAEL